jgi:hypothetical protein
MQIFPLRNAICLYVFLPWRRFVPETFCAGDVLLRRRFVTETFCMETFCRGDVLCGDVLYVRLSYTLYNAVLRTTTYAAYLWGSLSN